MYDQPDDANTNRSDSFRTITVRIKRNVYDTVDTIARDTGETVSSIVRDMLRRGIEQRQGAR